MRGDAKQYAIDCSFCSGHARRRRMQVCWALRLLYLLWGAISSIRSADLQLSSCGTNLVVLSLKAGAEGSVLSWFPSAYLNRFWVLHFSVESALG